ncbi:AsmA-like C-terminal domain-containing protein [Pannonibacter tanglangensis]|uniref:DUF3971 domain-containing protein n=1 Tax=Pannonibacter tanglangensis TaxID=2750084 RepID=A0ABW9ZD32_9HYPH|nr:hypothetical protein [Pannonibacter sp. XCT-34]
MLVLLAGILALALRLALGPTPIPLLAGLIESTTRGADAELTVGRVLLDLSAEQGPTAIIEGAVLKVPGEAQVDLVLPRLQAVIALEPLLAGTLNFTRLEIDGPRLTLRPGDADTPIASMGDMMEAVDRTAAIVDAEFQRRSLAEVLLRDGRLDVIGPVPRRINEIDAVLRRDAEGGLLAEAEISGRMGVWDLALRRAVVSDSGERQIGLYIRDMALAELFPSNEKVNAGKGLGLPLEVQFNAALDGTGAFEVANLVARGQDGWLRSGSTLIRFDDVALALAWSAGTPGVTIGKSHVIRGNTEIFFSGAVRPPAEGGSDWTYQISTDRARFGSADVPEPPMIADYLALEGRVNLADRAVLIDRLQLQSGPASFQAIGSLDLRDDGPYLALAVDAQTMPVAMLKQIWPITLAPPARRWIIEHLKGGQIQSARVDAAIGAPAFDESHPDPGWGGDDLKLDIVLVNTDVQPLATLPPITGLTGTVTIQNELLTVDMRSGSVTTPSGGSVAVPAGRFEIPHLSGRDIKTGLLDLKLQGGLGPLSEIANAPPFRILDKAELSDIALTGSGDIDVTAKLPLKLSLAVAEVGWAARAKLTGFAADKPVRGHRITDATLQLTADPLQVDIKGKGRIDGLQANIDLVYPLDDDSQVEARQDVQLKVTTADLRKKGVDLGDLVEGTMVLDVAETPEGQQFEIDLKEASLRLSEIGWEKGPGVAARASFLLTDRGEARRLENFSLRSDGVALEGTVALGKGGEFREADFSTFQIRPGDSAALKVVKDSAGRVRVTLTGAQFDGRGLIRQLRDRKGTSEDESDDDTAFRVSLKIGRLQGFQGVYATDVAGEVAGKAGDLTSMRLTGALNNQGAFTFEITGEGEARAASGEFADTGALLRFLDLYERMQGGTGRLLVSLPADKTWFGTFGVRGFSITEDPALRKLAELPEISRPMPDSQPVPNGAAMSRNGEASFDRMDIRFSRKGDTLTVEEGILQGAAVGGTVLGTVDLDTRELALTGTFVPIFALNNLFARIPVLGFALSGGSQEGLIGVTYRLSGPISAPALTVNPVSAIAPGIFRKMFEFR